MPTIPIDGDSITLGQFLKLTGLIDQGGAAKALLAEGRVTVNGAIEVRRGRKLMIGDAVVVDGGTDEGPAIVGGSEAVAEGQSGTMS